MTEKEQLIERLESERQWFEEISKDITDHELAIEYLKTGNINGELEENELLDACVNDFQEIYKVYCEQ